MSKNRWVNTRFWVDGYVTELDPIEKLLFLYCITNDNTALCGAYEIPLKHIAADTGIDKDMIVKIFARFAEADKIAYVDGHVIVRNFRKYQADNDNIRKGIEREENELPERIKDSLSKPFHRLSKDTDTLLIPILKPKPIGKDVATAPGPNEVYLYWEETIAPITTTQETQRKSAVTLLNRYGAEPCKKMIRVVAHAHANQYARKEAKCQSLTSLLGNWDKVVIYAKAQHAQAQQPQKGGVLHV